MLSLVWFKRDLRVHDHPALVFAAAQGRVLPVHVIEPDQWAQGDASARHLAFLAECLQSLRVDLAALGQPLILRAGDAVEVLARLHAKHGFAQIVSHDETGNAWSRARDARVAGWARDKGLPWAVLPQPLSGAVLAPPALAPVADGTGVMPGLKALGLAEDRCPFRQSGGRAAGEQAIEAFLGARAQGPARALTILAAERGGARLSPYLAWGVLSARALAEAVRGQPSGPALRGLLARLRHRETVLRAPLAEVAAAGGDAGLRTAWRAGETGLPFVDAAMRALVATGWSSDRGRALLAAVAVHHLGLDPRQATHDLARLFTDHDPAIYANEMVGVNASRIPDPVFTGQQQDPQGAFIRRWLPELARIPDAHLHAPWTWPPARRLLAGRYPEPVVDPASAGREARAVIRARSGGITGAPRRAVPPVLIEPAPLRAAGAQMVLDL